MTKIEIIIAAYKTWYDVMAKRDDWEPSQLDLATVKARVLSSVAYGPPAYTTHITVIHTDIRDEEYEADFVGIFVNDNLVSLVQYCDTDVHIIKTGGELCL